MPILTSDYVGAWYYFTYNNVPIMLESWNESQDRATDQKKLIQGDIGTHVMSAGGMSWVTDIGSPVLITTSTINTPIDIVFYFLNNLYLRNENINLYGSLLKSASIDISEQGVHCKAQLWSDVALPLAPVYNLTSDNWTAREANFYDTQIGINGAGVWNALSGSINIDVDITANYFIGGGQIPSFAVQGYTIKGNLKLAVPLTDTTLTILQQTPNELYIDSSMIQVIVAQYDLFPLASSTPVLWSVIKRDIEAAKITSLDISFESYAKRFA